MARNRGTLYAPVALQSMTKTTLADLVWEFAAHAADSVDDLDSRCRVIVERCADVGAPRADMRIAQGLAERLIVKQKGGA